MEFKLLSPEDPAWSEALAAAPHDVYHRPEYVALEARRTGGQAMAAVVRDERGSLFVPMVVVPQTIGGRPPAGGGALDALSPYGYPTPLLTGADESFADAAIEALRAGLADRRVAALFVRIHPLLALPAAFRRHGTLVQHGETVWIDLTLTEEELWRQTRPRFRSYINRLREHGLTARIDTEFARYDRFKELYTETMDHAAAASWYYFGSDYFEALRVALGAAMALCVVETPTGEVVSAGLFTVCGGVMQYHLSGTNKTGEHQDALKLMIDFMRGFGKACGYTRLHLGGGLGAASDSLFAFKAGFSKLRSPFHTWHLICDPGAFDAALEEWNHLSGGGPCQRSTDYFPPYRQPLPE